MGRVLDDELSDGYDTMKGDIIFDADDVGSNMATLNLLADAPLLLEEVKRLRRGIRDIIEEMQEWTDDEAGAILKNVFIDELKEVIE